VPSLGLSDDALAAKAKKLGVRPAPAIKDKRQALIYSLWFDGFLQEIPEMAGEVAAPDRKYGERPPLRGRRRAVEAINRQIGNRK